MDAEVARKLKEARVIDTQIKDVATLYNVGDVLGEGRFSQVYSAVKWDEASVAQKLALKAVEKRMLEEDEEAVDALVQEVNALGRAYAAAGRSVPRTCPRD